MRLDPIFLFMPSHRMTKIGWSSSGGYDDFFAYDYATGSVQSYPDEKNALVKRQKVHNSPMVPVIVPAVDMS